MRIKKKYVNKEKIRKAHMCVYIYIYIYMEREREREREREIHRLLKKLTNSYVKACDY